MYALYLVGPIVEQLYGRATFLWTYLVCIAAGSIATYAFGGAASGVGRVRRDLRAVRHRSCSRSASTTRWSAARAGCCIGQIGVADRINLGARVRDPGHRQPGAPGWARGRRVPGLPIPPGRVPTTRTMWKRPDGTISQAELTGRIIGLVALGVVLVVGFLIGTAKWSERTCRAVRGRLVAESQRRAPRRCAPIAWSAGGGALSDVGRRGPSHRP